MSLFFSSKNISTQTLERILKGVKSIDAVERAYIVGLFQQYKQNGISREEVEEAIRDMIKDTGDAIDPKEAEDVKEALFAELGAK